jgi:hypothetical protein
MSDKIISAAVIVRAGQSVAAGGVSAAQERLAETEPDLAFFLSTSAEVIVGRLALSGAPPEVTRGVFEDVMRLTLTAVEATRGGLRDFWSAGLDGDQDEEDESAGECH